MFKKKANEVVSFLQEEFSDVDYDLNPDKPRKGAFNISVKVTEILMLLSSSSALSSNYVN